jgi:hypothetical protein
VTGCNDRSLGAPVPFTSPRLRGEVGAKRRVRGYRSDHGLRIRRKSPSPQPSPRKSGARECSAAAETRYRLRPSIGVNASFASSMPSMQLTFSATTAVPSDLLPRANTSTPQSMQS